ncbi:MAG: hypothetical protein IJF71_03825 [Clostridia bacterium]|nr:hypothetical protein [Clostridia bacterium]
MNYQAILEYQKVDGLLRKIENELKNSEERKRASQAKAFLLESEETSRRMDHRAEELIAAYHKLCEKQERESTTLAEYEASVEESKNDLDELRYIEKKIAQLADSLKKIDNEIAALQRDIEEVAREFNSFRKRFAAAKEEYKTYKQKYDELKKSRAAEINAIKEQLATLAAGVEPAMMEMYTQKRADKLYPVFVEIRSNMCGVCSMELSLGDKAFLKENGYVECEHCKRVLYLAE